MSVFIAELVIPPTVSERNKKIALKETEQKLDKMTSLGNLRQDSVWIYELLEMIYQELKGRGTKYQALLYFGMCCREPGGSKLRGFAHACAVSALSLKDGSKC